MPTLEWIGKDKVINHYGNPDATALDAFLRIMKEL